MKIVGISACPAGLAHTPMAAKALEKAGAKALQEIGVPADTPSTVPSSAILAVNDEIKSLITSSES